MAVDLASSWCATDLGDYRPCRYTYERYPLGSAPPVRDALGGFRWLGDPGQREVGNVDLLARLNSSLNAVGVALPEDFVEFYSSSGWSTELDAVSVTGCWTRIGPLPTFSPVEPGAFLVRFMSDQQDCVTWYLYLRRGEQAFVVHAYGLEPDYEDDDAESGGDLPLRVDFRGVRLPVLGRKPDLAASARSRRRKATARACRVPRALPAAHVLTIHSGSPGTSAHRQDLTSS